MTPRQCRAGRALTGMTQFALARAAKVGLSTVRDYETGRRDVSAEAIARLRAALERAGVEFTNGKRPGVRIAT
jgi:transcriptional regulator with XRE-family HTH domain